MEDPFFHSYECEICPNWREEDDITNEDIANFIERRRKDKGMTVKTLCEKTKIPRSTMDRYRKASVDIPISSFLKICNELGIDVEKFRDKDNKKT